MRTIAICNFIKYSLFILFPLSLVIVALIDRLGDAKDKIRDEAQILLLKLMDQVAPPMVGLQLKFLFCLLLMKY